MAKARSPQYPTIGLREAVQKVMAIYEADYQNPIPRGIAAQHMGYNTLNGKSLGVLSALGKFELLEGRGDQTRVSDLAVTIIAHQPGDPERIEAIRHAASGPELFKELESRYPGGKASEGALRSYLLTQKFIPSAADTVIRSYRETMDFVEEQTRGYDVAPTAPKGPVVQHSTAEASILALPVRSGGGMEQRTAEEIANIRVSKDCAIRLIADGPYSKRSIEALVKNLQLQLELGTYDNEEQPPKSAQAQ